LFFCKKGGGTQLIGRPADYYSGPPILNSMLVSPCPRPQNAVQDPSVGLRRTAVCIFSLCLAFVALSSLDVFKQSDDSLVEPTSPELGEALLLRPLAPIHASGNELSALKNDKVKPGAVDHSLLDSAKSALRGSEIRAIVLEVSVSECSSL
jgi:hypothetical protein